LVILTACGGGHKDEPLPANDPPPAPSGPTDDHGAVSATYPSFAPDFPLLKNNGGKVLTSPVIVAVTWPDSANNATYEALVDTIGGTSYWKEIVGEYGVGPATSGAANHVHETVTLTLSTTRSADPVEDVAKFVSQRLQDPSASRWPTPTDQTIYALFLSGKVAQTICDQGSGGLHDSVVVNGNEVAFALILECQGTPERPALDDTTISASHEISEASVDPYPSTKPGWAGVDQNHLAFELMMAGQDENADLCEIYDDAYGKFSSEMPYAIQRQWSNASAATGHSPCVPRTADPYFNVTPVDDLDPLTLSLPRDVPFSPSSKGVKLDVGATRKIALGIYSDAATDPIEVSAFEADVWSATGDGTSPTTHPTADIQLDKSSGQNGEKTYLTIKLNSVPSQRATVVVVQTKLGALKHYMPLLVGPGVSTQ
jgi:hypothetical protein